MSREATAGNPGTGSREGKFIKYSSNNSGVWWLKDEDWEKLEKAGWKVVWFVQVPVYLLGFHLLGEDGLPWLVDRPRDGTFLSPTEDGRWLGARAMYAYRAGLTLEQAKAEFAKITGQNPEDEGCRCCGRPHRFSEEVGVYG